MSSSAMLLLGFALGSMRDVTGAPDIEYMGINVKAGPNFCSEVSYKSYGDKFLLKSSEPKSDGGCGEGPNPMEYAIMALPVCQSEESMVIASQLGFDKWKNVSWRSQFDVDLSGYYGARAEPMAATDIFRRVFIAVKPEAGVVSEAELQQLKDIVLATCPIARVFASAGVLQEQTWSFSNFAENPELTDTNEYIHRMGATIACAGLSCDVAVDGLSSDVGQVTLAEPVADGGSGKGPNPMEALITSFATCNFETSLVIAKEENVESWAVDIDCTLKIDLDGYDNKPGKQNMLGKDALQHIVCNSIVDTTADQSTIDKIAAATLNRCPVARLFDDAGVKISDTWTKSNSIVMASLNRRCWGVVTALGAAAVAVAVLVGAAIALAWRGHTQTEEQYFHMSS